MRRALPCYVMLRLFRETFRTDERLTDSRLTETRLTNSRLTDSRLTNSCLSDSRLSNSCLLRVVGLRVAGLRVVGLRVAGFWVVGLRVAGFWVAGFWVACVRVVGCFYFAEFAGDRHDRLEGVKKRKIFSLFLFPLGGHGGHPLLGGKVRRSGSSLKGKMLPVFFN